MRFPADTTNITLSHDRRAQNDLMRAAFPDLNFIIQYIDARYHSLNLFLDIIISYQPEWKDRSTWADQLNSIHTAATEDRL